MTTDDAAFGAQMRQNPALREEFCKVFDAGFHKVECEAGMLTLVTLNDLTEDSVREQTPILSDLTTALEAIPTERSPNRTARFGTRIALLEASCLAWIGFAYVGVIESLFNAPGDHLDRTAVFIQGLR